MLGRVAGGIGDFFAWWGRELAGLVPGFVRRALSGDRGEAIFAFDGDTLVLARRIGGREQSLGTVALAGRSQREVRHEARRRLGRLDPDRATVVLRLPAGRVLLKSIELPFAAEENLREVVAFEMDRRTPFKAGDVYYDQRVAARDAKAQRLEVDLAVAPRRVVHEALAEAARWRLWPDRIEVPGDKRAGETPLDLMPPRERGGSGLARALRAALVTTALGLLAATLLIPLDHQRQVAGHLREQARMARAEAQAADSLRAEIERRLAGGRGVVERRLATPLALAVLDELTALMPDDSWAFQVQLRDREVQLHGYSPTAAQLIGRFEQSARLSDVRFRSPVTRDPRVGLERFHLSARVEAEVAP